MVWCFTECFGTGLKSVEWLGWSHLTLVQTGFNANKLGLASDGISVRLAMSPPQNRKLPVQLSYTNILVHINPRSLIEDIEGFVLLQSLKHLIAHTGLCRQRR